VGVAQGLLFDVIQNQRKYQAAHSPESTLTRRQRRLEPRRSMTSENTIGRLALTSPASCSHHSNKDTLRRYLIHVRKITDASATSNRGIQLSPRSSGSRQGDAHTDAPDSVVNLAGGHSVQDADPRSLDRSTHRLDASGTDTLGLGRRCAVEQQAYISLGAIERRTAESQESDWTVQSHGHVET